MHSALVLEIGIRLDRIPRIHPFGWSKHSRSVFGLDIEKVRLMYNQVAPECRAFYLDIVVYSLCSPPRPNDISRGGVLRHTAATAQVPQLLPPPPPPPPANGAVVLRRGMAPSPSSHSSCVPLPRPSFVRRRSLVQSTSTSPVQVRGETARPCPLYLFCSSIVPYRLPVFCLFDLV
jgi:hypothetical protein